MDGQRVDGAARLLAERRSTLVMVGNFDGVHRGHLRVLERGLREADALSLAPVVLTFDPHPAEVLGRGRRAVLTPLDRKVQLLSALSPRLRVVVEPFNQSLANLTPEQFAHHLLAEQLGAARVLTGQNFLFGRGRQGNPEQLEHLGHQFGFTAAAEPLGTWEGEVISSTRIRQLLSMGDVAKAAHLLGRPHALTGTVVTGQGLARSLGVPSANLGSAVELLPLQGVYSVTVDRLDGAQVHPLGAGVANIGTRPTLGKGPLRAEVHILGAKLDLYNHQLRVHLVERLRGEQHFAGIDQLKAQLERDKVAAARSVARCAARVNAPTTS